MTSSSSPSKPVLIVGAGISGLLLAQSLRKSGVAFRIFERDADLTTRGVGWGLTLHWCLPALRQLLPDDLVRRLPEAYVDRAAVARGEASTFPFYDLATGTLQQSSRVPESHRIRVTRERLRALLCTGLDIQWGKEFTSLREHGDDSVEIAFADGSSYEGCLVAACDGSQSPLRRALFPDAAGNHTLPVQLLGLKADFTPEQIAGLRELDRFFLQGCASTNDSFAYFSFLDAPSNPLNTTGLYSLQMAISWPLRPGFWGQDTPLAPPADNAARLALLRDFARTWAEPFRSIVMAVPEGTDVKPMTLGDWAPPKTLRGRGRVALLGDALHAMVMYRGEGANHAIIDVLDLFELVVPSLAADADAATVRAAIDQYEDRVVARTRPAVLASRKACLDAHEWEKIVPTSPLLSKRAMILEGTYE